MAPKKKKDGFKGRKLTKTIFYRATKYILLKCKSRKNNLEFFLKKRNFISGTTNTLESANIMQTMMKLMLSQQTNTAEDISTHFDLLADNIQITKQKSRRKGSEGMKKAHKIIEYY
jgi:hypothetical protein